MNAGLAIYCMNATALWCGIAGLAGPGYAVWSATLPGSLNSGKRKGIYIMHPSTFGYLKPTDDQLDRMTLLRAAFAQLSATIEDLVPDGPDRTYTQRCLRECSMWANVAITREYDGKPRE
jgi:hypothetical protein